MTVTKFCTLDDAAFIMKACNAYEDNQQTIKRLKAELSKYEETGVIFENCPAAPTIYGTNIPPPREGDDPWKPLPDLTEIKITEDEASKPYFS